VTRPSFSRGIFATEADIKQALETWSGVLDAGTAKLRFNLRLSEPRVGQYTAVLNIPERGPTPFAVDSATLKAGQFHFELTALLASYDGALSADGSQIVGLWKEGGQAVPLTLKRESPGK
jgi:hypothetical protein